MFICENCGKEHDGSYGSGRFCCASCRASFTNKQRGKHSEETKQKISESVKAKIASGAYIPHNQYTCNNSKYKYVYISIESLVDSGIILNPNNYQINNKLLNKYKIIKHICPVCNKEHYGYINKRGNISTKFCSDECKRKSIKHKPQTIKTNIIKLRKCCVCGKLFEVKQYKNGLSKSKTCSEECHYELKKNIGKQTYLNNVKNGTFQGWKTRNIISYAEKFWIEVLKNNNIDFIREYTVKIDNTHHYFLDFYIVKNNICIDLEIDGKQHKYEDRILHDKERDEFLASKNILVYRIEWNEIKSDKGSSLMKEKIDNFLIWYNNL